MSEEGKQLSRAQKRRLAKREKAGGDGEGDEAPASSAAAAGAPAAAAPKAAVTPEKVVPATAKKTLTPPKDEKQSQPSVSKLAEKMGDLKVSSDSSETEDDRRPLRPNELCNRMGRGSSGVNAPLVSNTYQLNFTPIAMHRYVVEFSPEIPPERIKQRQVIMRKFNRQVRTAYGETFFDGTTLLTMDRKENSTFTLDPPAEDSIHIRFIKSIDTTDKNVQEVNNVTNVVVKKLLRRLGMIQIGRSYFYPEPKALAVSYRADVPKNEQYRLRLYTGFNCSVQPCLMGNLMTIDLVSRVVQEMSVRSIMGKIMDDVKRRGDGKEQYYQRAKDLLIGSTVLCTYNNRAIRIDDIDFTKTMMSTFNIDRPAPANKPRGNLGDRVGEITFRDYLVSRYPDIGTRNQLPPVGHVACNVPGLLVNTPRKAGTTLRPTVLVPELCYLTGLDDKMRSNQSLMKALNTETRLAPSRRVKAIQELIVKMHRKTAEVDAKDGKLCVELGGDHVRLKGRVLGEVKISMPKGPPKTLTDNKSFSNEIRSCGFFDGNANVGVWAIIYPEATQRTAATVATTMRQLAAQQGANLGNAQDIAIPQASSKDSKVWQQAINTALQRRPAFILFLNPDADSFVYSVVKHCSTVQNSVVTQVMDSTKLDQNAKMLKPICGNTLKQILAKLGFQNWRVDITNHLPNADKKSTMFVGVDVSHDKLLKGSFQPATATSRGRRSTVGFCASRNASYHAYNSYVSYQDPDTEFLTEGKRLMQHALDDYFAENKAYPTSICVYRDGVGDSQLTTFVRQEIKLWREAFESKNITPKLTVIVVQKRVNLRLFAQCPVAARTAQRCPIDSKCQGRDEYHSPMAGTVVDDVITSAMLSDFYLVPSIAPPGATARPTRFIVLIDDMKLASQPDALQNMTNQMCYQYFNWPGPIRVPACVMYAHKIAYLFGKHVTGNPNPGLAKNLFFL